MYMNGVESGAQRQSPYQTEVRHSASGKTCHHFLRYRMTCDEYDGLLARAAGRCEICGAPEAEVPRQRLLIDHFQAGDEFHVRGLVCYPCNTVMSCLDGNKTWGDNRRWEQAAKRYAENSWQEPGGNHWT